MTCCLWWRFLRTRPMQVPEETFEDLRASLVWGAELPLTDEQRIELRPLCSRIGAVCRVLYRWPSAKKRQEAEQRVKEIGSRPRMPNARYILIFLALVSRASY